MQEFVKNPAYAYGTLKTSKHPEKPLMAWDGNCGFCHWWIIRWQLITGDAVDYQKNEIVASEFRDIPKDRFDEAVRLIDTDGTVYAGAQAAFKAFSYGGRKKWLYNLYDKSSLFARLSERIYHWISGRRSFLYKATVLAFGKNPLRKRPYWLLYISLLVFFIGIIAAR